MPKKPFEVGERVFVRKQSGENYGNGTIESFSHAYQHFVVRLDPLKIPVTVDGFTFVAPCVYALPSELRRLIPKKRERIWVAPGLVKNIKENSIIDLSISRYPRSGWEEYVRAKK